MSKLAGSFFLFLAASAATAQVASVELELGEPLAPLSTLAAEKALRGLPDVGTVTIDLGHAQIVVSGRAEGPGLDPTPLPEVLADAGLSVTRIRVVAIGTLATSPAGTEGTEPTLTLELSGPLPRVTLSGGARFPELPGNRALAGTKLRVSGAWSRGGAGSPPTLTVDEWAVAAE